MRCSDVHVGMCVHTCVSGIFECVLTRMHTCCLYMYACAHMCPMCPMCRRVHPVRWRFPTSNDFGGEIIPASAAEYNVQAYLFDDYWEDIGTIKSFYDANLALTEPVSDT